MKVDIVTSDDIKIHYTKKFQDFTDRYIIKCVFFLEISQKSRQKVKKSWM